MCTLKIIPTLIEHCIEYAGVIFTELFDLYINDIKMIVEDENKFNDILKDSLNLIELYLRLKILKYLYNIFDSPTDYNIME